MTYGPRLGAHNSHFKYPQGLFFAPGEQPRDPADRQKLGFVNVTANAGDVIIMPLRLNHAVLPWLPTDRDRVVLFYTYIPQFYFSELPPTTITTETVRAAAIEVGAGLDEATADLVANRDKGVMKEVVRRHLATVEADAPARPPFNPAE